MAWWGKGTYPEHSHDGGLPVDPTLNSGSPEVETSERVQPDYDGPKDGFAEAEARVEGGGVNLDILIRRGVVDRRRLEERGVGGGRRRGQVEHDERDERE